MIVDGGYVFRKGREGDRSASRYIIIGARRYPEFGLELNGVQIGVAHGSNSLLRHIEIFENVVPHSKGHGTKFIELWERYGRKKGWNTLTVVTVTSPVLAHILKDKRGFTFQGEDSVNGPVYVKIL